MDMINAFEIPYSPVNLPKASRGVEPGGIDSLDMGIGEPESATETFNKLIQKLSADLQQRMANRSAGLEQQAQKMQDGVPSGWEFEFEVTFNEQHWNFDRPTVTMRLQTWSFDFPKVGTKEASFDVPDGLEWRTEHKYLGDFFQCRSLTDCGLYPAYMDVPVAVLKTKRITMNVPDIIMERSEFKLDVPEFGTETVDWYVKIPEFKLVRSAATYAQEAEKKADELKVQASEGIKQDVLSIRDTYKNELLQAATAVAQEAREEMTTQYNMNLAFFNGAIESVQAQILTLPESARSKYQENLDSLIANRQALIDQYLTSMQSTDEEIQKMVQNVLESFGAAAGL